MNTRTVIYYNKPLGLNGNTIYFENNIWGRFGSLQMHYQKFFNRNQ